MVSILEETGSVSGDKAMWHLAWRGKVFMRELASDSGSVAILLAPLFQLEILRVKGHMPGHLLQLTVHFGGTVASGSKCGTIIWLSSLWILPVRKLTLFCGRTCHRSAPRVLRDLMALRLEELTAALNCLSRGKSLGLDKLTTELIGVWHWATQSTPDQSYSILSRSIHNNIHLVRDMIRHSQRLAGRVPFSPLDQEKAFDKSGSQVSAQDSASIWVQDALCCPDLTSVHPADLQGMCECLEIYSAASSARINWSKCLGLLGLLLKLWLQFSPTLLIYRHLVWGGADKSTSLLVALLPGLAKMTINRPRQRTEE
eukprot:g37119.t1